MRGHGSLKATLALLALVGLGSGPPRAQEGEPAPPRRSLGEVAKNIKLRLPEGTRKLDNEAVKKLGEGVTLSAHKSAKPKAPTNLDVGSWQKRYQEARARVKGLELFLEKAKGNAAPAAGTPEAAILERSIRRAETELEIMRGAPEQVVREALAVGGTREWFANLPEPEPVFPSWIVRHRDQATR